jgi:prepilin-type N-terminal cleavage/methylation domain-containing protein
MISHLSNHRSTRNVGTSRYGFTLVEILIVVTIIGLLVGMLVAVGGPAITRAREFAVTNEITQMSQSIENFKTEYSFYPPSFLEITSPNELLPFLNKISPNHRELEFLPGATSGPTRLENWWTNVGSNLDQRSSLVFWLSAIAHNQQYPLSDPATGTPLAAFDDGSGVERRILFEFDTTRLRQVDATGAVDTGGLPNVRGYDMPYGKQNGRLLYVYREAASYDFEDITTGDNTTYFAYNTGIDANGNPIFINPNTFQLVAAGMDGDFGEPITENPSGPGGNIFETDPAFALKPAAADNLCNFADGRLDRFIADSQ